MFAIKRVIDRSNEIAALYPQWEEQDRAAADPKFLQLVVDNIHSDEIPDITAWPYSEETYVTLRRQIRSVMVGL